MTYCSLEHRKELTKKEDLLHNHWFFWTKQQVKLFTLIDWIQKLDYTPQVPKKSLRSAKSYIPSVDHKLQWFTEPLRVHKPPEVVHCTLVHSPGINETYPHLAYDSCWNKRAYSTVKIKFCPTAYLKDLPCNYTLPVSYNSLVDSHAISLPSSS